MAGGLCSRSCMTRTHQSDRAELRDVAALFLRLGFSGFGGPAAHIAMMEEEVVHRRGWLSSEEFLDLLGAVNLMPGPSSTELAIFIGYRRAGWAGLVLGGVCFILPAILIVSVIAWAYVRYGALPQAAGILYGVKPVVIAVVAQALWTLGRKAVKTWALAVICGGVFLGGALSRGPLVLLLAAGVCAALFSVWRKSGGARLSLTAALNGSALGGSMAPAAVSITAPVTLPAVFLVFLKIGSVLFGSGYVLLAFLRSELVESRHWLTESQLLDAVAVGQFTPGPVLTTATFVGYILGGPVAGLVATVGIFAPAFVFIALGGRFVPILRRSRTAGAFLDGVNAASVALMAVVLCQLGAAALVDWLAIGLALGAFLCLLWKRLNSSWLMLGGAAVGLVASIFQKSGTVGAH